MTTRLPSQKELRKFLEVFSRLSEYESMQRFNRGYGVFSADETLPIPEVVAVVDWLTKAVGVSSVDSNMDE